MTRAQGISLAMLALLVLASGIGVVAAKYESRTLFVELQAVRLEKDHADMEWGRLQLELATRGGMERVMRVASERLQMHVPEPEQIVVVR